MRERKALALCLAIKKITMSCERAALSLAIAQHHEFN
jgi:hypothetical protein